MGREPTSASCHTCRRRRIKCDKGKPSCGQCEKSRYECLGYERILRIQSHGVGLSKQPGRSSLVKIGESGSYPTKEPVENDDDDDSQLHGHDRGGKCRRKKPQKRQITGGASPAAAASQSQNLDTHLPQALISQTIQPSLDPFIDNIAFSYFFDAYSWINIHSILLQDTPMRQHLTEQRDELGYDSLRALAYGIFGRDHQVQSLQHKSGRIYGTALQKLQTKLTTSSKPELAALIKPISIMGSYAIAVDSDLRFIHHQGLARILEHCGPEYFQNPSILPVFESCRFTMLANALVQRQGTFLDQERWRIVPWSTSPETKTATNKLLDIISSLPALLQKTDKVLNERSQWVAGNSDVIREETPSTVSDLQAQLESMLLDLIAWRYHWSLDNFPTAQNILDWALFRVGDESYRPGISHVQGPDVYGLNLGTTIGLDIPFGLTNDAHKDLDANSNTFALVQEAALYITALISMERLRKNLAGAARAAEAVDFYNAPFFSTCRCYFDNPGPSRLCQIFPEPSDNVSTAASWNINSARVAESPIRSLSGDSAGASTKPTARPLNEEPILGATGTMLLPGDGRFSAQLRILNWLIKHLPESRAHVLATLAAMGLSHCVHDVRPSEGNEYIAETVRDTMMKSRFGDAAEVLLKRYRMPNAHFRHRDLLRWDPDHQDVESSDEEFEEFALLAGLRPVGGRFYEGANVYRIFCASGAICWCQLRDREWTDRLTLDEAASAIFELRSQGLITDGQSLFDWWVATEIRRGENERE
ncbi:transcriptional regulator family: Fungal Specific TF [Trichoderma aggressivum f. europaeum]|uniref:Transcriptional regulator family: Fungal Specific TF n=1 Tax=Trichoderma aggressivum f. europaeum TaxID=173218 RepID=A0AAE1M545_9HYPO|nr:transcriptional regulator family: Fungal Specific TF [Trichoderma aggressivum f. europaeum]